LNEENAEEKAEIETNQMLIKSGKRTGANSGNINPKVRKWMQNLFWNFEESEIHTPEKNPT
jgi:hypothetical protein